MVEKVSVKLGKKSREYLMKLGNNINSNTCNKAISLDGALEIVADYLKIVKWYKEKNNGS